MMGRHLTNNVCADFCRVLIVGMEHVFKSSRIELCYRRPLLRGGNYVCTAIGRKERLQRTWFAVPKLTRTTVEQSWSNNQILGSSTRPRDLSLTRSPMFSSRWFAWALSPKTTFMIRSCVTHLSFPSTSKHKHVIFEISLFEIGMTI